MISGADYFADTKVIYRRYASLFFICSISPSDNELITLEVIHRYVEVLDRYFGNVSKATSVGRPDVDFWPGVRAGSHLQLPKGLCCKSTRVLSTYGRR
jgi:hypothetical protein